jgi:hypothetical protein
MLYTLSCFIRTYRLAYVLAVAGAVVLPRSHAGRCWANERSTRTTRLRWSESDLCCSSAYCAALRRLYSLLALLASGRHHLRCACAVLSSLSVDHRSLCNELGLWRLTYSQDRSTHTHDAQRNQQRTCTRAVGQRDGAVTFNAGSVGV